MSRIGGVTGTKELDRRLKKLKSKTRSASAKAMRHAVKPLVSKEKSAAPKVTGSLKKALGSKVKSYSKSAVGVVGARFISFTPTMNGKGKVKYKAEKGRSAGKVNGRKTPAFTVHFAEKDYPRTKGTHFMQRSFRSSENQIQGILAQAFSRFVATA